MSLHFIESSVLQGDTLWLLYSTGVLHPKGRLFSLDLNTGQMEEITFPSSEAIEQFCILSGGAVLIATSNRELWQYSPDRVTFITRLPGSSLPELLEEYGLDNQSTLHKVFQSGMVKGQGCPIFRDRIHSLVPRDDGVMILTSSSVLEYNLASGTWKTVPLLHFIPKAMRMPAFSTNDGYFYQGTCLGEDGGDLKRINTKTGAIDILYEGTQVTSVIRDPWNRDSALFSTGTWHMGLNRGGIYRAVEGRESFFSGKAVYSITSDSNDVIAAAPDGVHRITNGLSERYDYPDHRLYDGIGVVTDKRFGTFVLTDIYRSQMVCGSVPLFAESGDESLG